MKVFLRPSSTLRRWFTKLGCDEAFVLQALQGRIDAANCYISTSALLKLLADRDTVGVLTQSDENQDHHQFKAAELVALGHLFF